MNSAFTYSSGIETRWKRFVVQRIETATGARRLRKLYASSLYDPQLDVWERAIRLLQLQIETDGFPILEIPRAGPLVLVANHPFGVVDGLTACYLLSRVRSDLRILINSVMQSVEEIRPYLLPIDFRETKDALQTNLRSRADARRHLDDGGSLIVFPSGGVSTSRKVFGPAVDAEWKTFTAKLVQSTEATVVPLYFHGQNSRLFQVASHLSLTLRLSLLVKEVCNKIGKQVSVTIGQPIVPEVLSGYRDRQELMQFLRNETYGLRPSKVRRRIERVPHWRRRRR